MAALRLARAAGFVAAALALTACAASTGALAQGQAKSQAIGIMAEAIVFDAAKPRRTRFGKLEWLGTLRLTSESRDFGGYSALAIDGAGARLLALSDVGTWLSAEIVYRDGRPAKLVKARTGDIPGLGGKPLTNKFEQDSEGLAMEAAGAVTGTAFISFERRHRIAVHTVTKDGVGPAKRLLKLPARARSAEPNKGLEGLARLRAGPMKGALIAFTEEYLDEKGDHVGWLIGGPKPGELWLKRIGGFAVTGLTSLPNGDLIVLERRFRFTEGVKMRLRRVKAGDIRPGALLDGEVLFEADSLYEIDNMEGLAAHVDASGRTILTLISDDNFNRTLQRTLLMQFAVVE